MENDNDRTEVIILTSHYRVEGRISLVPDARVTDFVLNEEKFILVTDAEVRGEEDNIILTSS
ncbi:MAG: hypothetical protein KAJ60_02850, partial [Desulfobulbaceae bacterium]|nr:hypothetical protein [Desulfobulbaceae bacterium]